MDNIKSCPFCGGPARMALFASDEENSYEGFVYCTKCRNRTDKAGGALETVTNNVIGAWNRRNDG